MPERVALITTSWPSREGDPAGHFIRAEARAMERAGAEVLVIAPAPGGAFGWPGVAARLRSSPLRAVSAARWVGQATLRLRGLDVDRVVCHWALPSAWPIALGAAAPVEVVSHGGDVRLLVAMPRPAREALTRTVAARSAEWRFVSESLKAELLGALGPATAARVERIAVVRPASVDFPEVAGAVARLRAGMQGRRTAVSVGRLVASKGVHRAITHVASGREFDALVVVGDGPERRRLERLARGAGARIVFVGAVPRDEALAWIAAADALIHASVAEGLSTVVREADALGTRVVRI